MEKGDRITVQVSAFGTLYTPSTLRGYRYKRGTRVYTTNGEEVIVRHRAAGLLAEEGSLLVLELDHIDKDGDMVYNLCSKNN